MAPGRHQDAAPTLVATLCGVLGGNAVDLPVGEERERLFELARDHRVEPLVVRARGSAPASVVSTLVPVLLDEVRVRELTRVLAALEAVGAGPLVFKGAALAHTHYPESWLRPRLDADILIASDRRQETRDTLCALGYQCPPFVSGDLVMYQTMFVRTDRVGVEHVLDVHWRIANRQVIAHVLTHEELVARAERVAAQGYSMRVPSAVDALMLACLHRAVHHDDTENVLWLYDIHLIASRLDPIEWRHFADRASERCVTALCARGLRLSRERLGTCVPADVLVQLTPDSGSPRELSAVFLRKDLRPVDRLWVDLRALGPWAGAHLVWEHVFPPAEYMQRAFGVRNRMLLPAYYAYRALGGASKWLRRRRVG